MPTNVQEKFVTNQDVKDVDHSEIYSTTIPMVNIQKGGQHGVLPAIGGVNEKGEIISEWMNSARYKKGSLIPIVLATPRGFDLLGNSKNWKLAIKAMIEVHAKSITGLDSSLTVATAETQMGLSGAMFKEITNVTRASSSVTINLEEKLGKPFTNLLDIWVRYLMKDPDLKVPLVTRVASGEDLPKLWSTDYFTMSVMFIEPDILNRTVVNAWLVQNLFPTTVPEITGEKFEKATDTAFVDLAVEMGGFAIHSTNRRVKKFADTILANLELYNLNPEDILIGIDKAEPELTSSEKLSVNVDGTATATDTTKGFETTGDTRKK